MVDQAQPNREPCTKATCRGFVSPCFESDNSMVVSPKIEETILMLFCSFFAEYNKDIVSA